MPAKYGNEIRERILKLRAQGNYTHQEIADELGISRHTVSNHLEDVEEETRNADDPDLVVQVQYKQLGERNRDDEQDARIAEVERELEDVRNKLAKVKGR